jgi:hypothetical protein
MASPNNISTLSFSNAWIRCTLVEVVTDVGIGDAVVVNLSTTQAVYKAGDFSSAIPPFQSKRLKRCTVSSAERIAVFELQSSENLGGLALAWDWFGKIYTRFNPQIPLYISPQEDVASLEFNPRDIFVFDGAKECIPQRFRLKLNLWYAPAQTDCSIHCEHSFLEVHTQIFGIGKMQKFLTADAGSIFEDLIVPLGVTHEPFFQFRPESGFKYPMHRYFAETECVWMAIELHPC